MASGVVGDGERRQRAAIGAAARTEPSSLASDRCNATGAGGLGASGDQPSTLRARHRHKGEIGEQRAQVTAAESERPRSRLVDGSATS